MLKILFIQKIRYEILRGASAVQNTVINSFGNLHDYQDKAVQRSALIFSPYYIYSSSNTVHILYKN